MTSRWYFVILIFGIHSTVAQIGYTRDNPSNQLAINPFGRPMNEADSSAGIDGEIPGEAGQDYPIYAAPPDTRFSCKSQAYPGYYADPDAQCQAFYICQKAGRSDAFLCPNGTIFNQENLVCDWWYNFDCSRAEQLYVVNEMVVKAMEAVDAKLRQSIGSNNYNVPISTVQKVLNNGGIQYSSNTLDIKGSRNQYDYRPNQVVVRPPISDVYNRQNNRVQFDQSRQFSNGQRRNDGYSNSRDAYAVPASTYRPIDSRSGPLTRYGSAPSTVNRSPFARNNKRKPVKNTQIRISNNFSPPSMEPIETGLSGNGFSMNRFKTNNGDNRFPSRSYLPPNYNSRRLGGYDYQGPDRMYLPPNQNGYYGGGGDRSFVTPLTSNHDIGYYQPDSQPQLNSNRLRNLFNGQDIINSGYNSYDDDSLNKSYLPPSP